jgi:hypothetical protein
MIDRFIVAAGKSNTRKPGTIEIRGESLMTDKSCNLFKVVRSNVLGLTMALLLLAVPAAAQSNNARTDNTTTTTTRTENRDDRRDDRNNDRDWGWLGLLGLAGLLGLMPRKRVPVVHETREERPPTTTHR